MAACRLFHVWPQFQTSPVSRVQPQSSHEIMQDTRAVPIRSKLALPPQNGHGFNSFSGTFDTGLFLSDDVLRPAEREISDRGGDSENGKHGQHGGVSCHVVSGPGVHVISLIRE